MQSVLNNVCGKESQWTETYNPNNAVRYRKVVMNDQTHIICTNTLLIWIMGYKAYSDL